MQGSSSTTTTSVIACGVFRPVMEHLGLERKLPGIHLIFLPPYLHVYPDKLHDHIRSAIVNARNRGDRIVCLYGDCFPGICDFCEEHGAAKVPGTHCYEMLLGSKCFKSVVDETAGAFFLERYLIEEFERCCAEPLELYDDEVRQYLFQHYKRLVYVRQHSDPDLVPRATDLARFLGLSLDVRDADYSHLARDLTRIITGDPRGRLKT